MVPEIRLACVAEEAAVRAFYYDLIDACRNDPHFPPWEKGIYPTDAMLASAVAAQTLYVGVENGEICAAMIVSHDVPKGYTDGVWPLEADDDEFLVLHILAVAPTCRRQGVGEAMVRYALELAKSTGMRSLRLDAWNQNAPAHALYRKLGFFEAGMMRETYDDGSFLDFWLFEYPLEEDFV